MQEHSSADRLGSKIAVGCFNFMMAYGRVGTGIGLVEGFVDDVHSVF